LHPAISTTIRKFRERFGAVGLTLEEAGTRDLISAVRAGTIDGAFIRTPISDQADFDISRVLSEPMVVAFPTGHPLLDISSAVSMASLSEEPFILYRRSSGPGFYDAIVSACRKAGFSPFIAQEAPRLTATLSLVAAGLGVTIVPASMQALRIEGIDFRDLRAVADLEAVIDFVTRTADPSPTLQLFAEVLSGAALG
jgi:DNA-binding transcriptional LysR family regulator